MDPVRNFAVGTLTAGLAAGATSFNLNSGEGSLFPDPSTEGAFNAVIYNSTDYADPLLDPQREIVRIGARSGDAFSSVTRGQEGTSDVAHNTAAKSYKLALVLTRKMIQDADARLTDLLQSYAADSGAANAYVITLTPAPTAYATGQLFRFKTSNANTGVSTLNVNGLGAKTIKGKGGADLAAGEISAGQVVAVQYDGTNFQLLSQSISPSTIQSGSYVFGTESGTANSHVLTVNPALTAYAAGQTFRYVVGNTNTGATQVNISGLGNKDIRDKEGVALVGGEIVAGTVIEIIYTGTYFQTLQLLARSEVWVQSGNGHGSTNNKIRRFTTAVTNVGASITYADSATNGGSFTINKPGLYAIAYNDNDSNVSQHGISLNSAQLTTNVGTITDSTRLSYIQADSAVTHYLVAQATVWLTTNDVIRAHTNGGQGTTFGGTSFRITRIA